MPSLHTPSGSSAAGRGRWTVPAAVVIALHGLAHGVAVVNNFTRASNGRSDAYLGGAVSISEPTVLRALAVAWAFVGLGLVLAAGLLVLRPGAAGVPVTAALAASLILCVAGVWAAVIGAVLDIALLWVVRRRPEPLFGAAIT